MSLHHRQELVKIARSFDVLLISDDVYDFLCWSSDKRHVSTTIHGALPTRIVDVDRALEGGDEWGNIASNGSFSKIVAPGMRVGWCEGTRKFTSALSTVYAPPCFSSPVISTYMTCI